MNFRNVFPRLLVCALFCLTGLMVGFPARASGDPKPVVAVFDIATDGFKMSDATVKQLTKYLGVRLMMGGRYQVIPEMQLKDAMAALKLESQKDCYDEVCRVKLGQEAAANKNLNVTVWKVGNRCSIIGAMYDLRAAASEEATEVADLGCDVEGLKVGISKFAAQLGGAVPVPVPVPTPLPPAPVVNDGGGTNNDDEPPPPVAAEIGYLSVEGSPKAARVDISGPSGFGTGGKVATSLPMAPMKVPAGQYRVTVGMTGYDQEEQSVRVYADATETVKVALVQSTGQVQISGKPEGAKSRIECQKGFARDFGLPASPWTVTVPRGQCRLTVERDGYEKHDASFEVAGGTVVRQTVEMKRDAGGSGISAGGGTTAGTGGIQWVRLSGGTFQRDSNSVTLSAFEIAATEVTVGQYRKCVDAGACTAPNTGGYCNWGKTDRDNHPVNCVDWNQATVYAKWVGGRLPTEAEWEYAARSVGRNQEYPWGDQTPSCRHAVIDDGSTRDTAGSETDGCGRDGTWPVCSKPAGNTAQGLCDMAGNVWEWVSDWYGSYPSGSLTNPTGPSTGASRVIRGGSWRHTAGDVRSAVRIYVAPATRDGGLGFRPARLVR